MNINNRNFITLLDFTKEEIKYLLDLSQQLKKESTQEFLISIYKIRMSYFYSKKIQQEQDVHLKLEQWI